MAALEYWLWLSTAPVSPRARYALAEHFGDAESAYLSPDGAFRNLKGLSPREAELLERRDLSGVKEVLNLCREREIRILTLADSDYPARLRNIPAPPVALYVRGKLPPVDECAPIAVIGTRRSTPYGLKMARELSWQIACCGGSLISLLSSPIDSASAKAALQAGASVLGVLPCPTDEEENDLIRAVCQSGAVLSEYAPGTPVQRQFFRERNRIAAGLSVGVLVVEAPEKSGTRLFAMEAAEQGKELFAVPGNADAGSSAGSLELLKEGAKLVTCGWDVMSEFEALYPGLIHRAQKPPAPEIQGLDGEREEPKPKPVPAPPRPDPKELERQLKGLSEPQLKIVTALGGETLHVDEIIERSQLSTAIVLSQLTVLEIKGYVRRLPGRRYILNIRKL